MAPQRTASGRGGKAAARPTKNVVTRAIDVAAEGSLSEFARKLSRYAGFEVSRQRVSNWKRRGNFSRDVVLHVHALTNIPLSELIEAPWLQGKE
jgi:hypothetical protein